MASELGRPAKYVRVMEAIRERISSGRYPAGSQIPTEEELSDEFGVSRPTVQKAVSILTMEGWVESQQGKGRYARSHPGDQRARLGLGYLDRDESASQTIETGHVIAPDWVAEEFGIKPGEAVLRRVRLVSRDDKPSELITAYFPVDIAYATDLGKPEPLPETTREHLARRSKGKVVMDHMAERISSRMPTPEEIEALGMASERVPVLVLSVTARDTSGRTIQVADVVLPADRHELEDLYSVN